MTSYPCFTYLEQKNNGLLAGARFDFAPGLNTLMGPRGAGKSTALEAIPFTVGVAPTKFRAARVNAMTAHNFAGALLRLGYRTAHGMVYRVEHPGEGGTTIFTERGEHATAAAADLIKFAFYGQNEFDMIGLDKGAQLALLDRFVKGDIEALFTDARRLERDLETNAGELATLRKELDELDEATADAQALEETLRAVQQAPIGADPRVVQRAHAHKLLRERELRGLDSVTRESAWLRGEGGRLATDGRRRLPGAIDSEVMQGPNGDLLAPVVAETAKMVDLVEQFATRLAKQGQVLDAAIAQSRGSLSERQSGQDAEYRTFLEQTHEESARTAARTSAQQKYAVVVEKKRTQGLRENEWQRRRDDRRKLLGQLLKLRGQVYQLRKDAAKRLSDELVEVLVDVGEGAGFEPYAALLGEILKGVKIGKSTGATIRALVKCMRPEDLCACAEANDTAPLVDKVEDLSPLMAGRLLDEIRKSGRLFELEVIACEDEVRIQLKDGSKPKPIEQVSQGQRAVALLMIILLEGDWPIIIDQPEDHLDGSYLSETLVKALLRVKKARQLIFVTHNATLLVLADADRNFVLNSDGEHSTIVAQGTVEETKAYVLKYLDGGPEAFLARKERYGF